MGLLRRLSCSLQFTHASFGQLPCPSPCFIHTLFFRFISPCSQFAYKNVRQFLISTSAYYHISTFTALLVPLHSFIATSFQQGSVHYAANIVVLAVPAIACVPGLYWHIATQMQACHIKPLHCAPITALMAILLCAPVAGTRRSTSVHSFLIHSSARCRLAGNTAF